MTAWNEVADRVFTRTYDELDLTVGLILGDSGCLVVDTRGDIEQGREMAAAVRDLTKDPWTVVLTHAHFDHSFGSGAFAAAQVWSHRRCRDTLVRHGADQRLRWAARYRADGKPQIATAIENTELVLPDRLVDDVTELDVGGRTVVFRHFGPAHTDHDLVVQVPEADVVFVGDLVERGAPPSFGSDATPSRWPVVLDQILALGPGTIVCGHGGPVDSTFVAGQRDDLRVVADLCQLVLADEITESEAVARSPFPADTVRAALAAAAR